MSLRQICNVVRHLRLQNAYGKRFFATEPKNEIVDISSVDEKPVYLKAGEDPQLREEIAKKRNKSRLKPHHRNVLLDLRPYDSPIEWYHHTVKYKKRILGKYGLKSIDEPAGFAWPTPEEIKDAQEYERCAYPLSLQESWEKLEEEKRLKMEEKKIREKKILEKVGKMEQWTAELQAKLAKKETALEAARVRKERLVEEVRRHFGFTMSPRDEKFKELLAQKEKEEKKKKKEAKKQARLEKLNKMVQKNMQATSNEQTTESKTESKTESTKSED